MSQQNNPLHGIKLETILVYLVDKFGWEELGLRFNLRCFTHDPSIKSSLTFLRKTQWARDKVEYLYLKSNKLPLPPPRDPMLDKDNPLPSTDKNVHTNAKSKQTNPKSSNTSKPKDASLPAANMAIWGAASPKE
jgi:uncharacterized protein (DUF2132 family)